MKTKVKGLMVLIMLFVVLSFLVSCTTNNNIPYSSNNDVSSQLQNSSSNNAPSSNQNSAPQTFTVDIRNFAFSPSSIIIHIGDTVVWTNYDSALHTVTSDSGSELNSAQLSNSQTYSHTFSTKGEFDYHCIVHPYMKAKVIVQ